MSLPPEAETKAGIECYATTGAPCPAKLRVFDEDFRVEEVLKRVGVSREQFDGGFPLYKVEKRSIDTLHLERALTSILGSRVSYAGIKDKRALAVQYVSPTSSRVGSPELIERQEFRCELVGYMRKPLSRSMIAGNRFRILLRDGCPELQKSIAETLETARIGRLPNFYGLQRFGSRDNRTHRIGRALVRRSFEEAVRLLVFAPRPWDIGEAKAARELISTGRYEEGLRLLPRGEDVERMVAHRLSRKPEDKLGAIRAVPIALRRLYVHAFQSYIFNRSLSLAMREGLDISKAIHGDNWGELSSDGLSLKKVHGVREPMTAEAVPLLQLVGYAYRNYGSRFDGCVEKVLETEGVQPREFYVKEMQEVSAEGGFRRAHMSVREASTGSEQSSAWLEFTLARGEYATVLLREVIKPQDPTSAGFD